MVAPPGRNLGERRKSDLKNYRGSDDQGTEEGTLGDRGRDRMAGGRSVRRLTGESLAA